MLPDEKQKKIKKNNIFLFLFSEKFPEGGLTHYITNFHKNRRII